MDVAVNIGAAQDPTQVQAGTGALEAHSLEAGGERRGTLRFRTALHNRLGT
jgi:hypothetical protein